MNFNKSKTRNIIIQALLIIFILSVLATAGINYTVNITNRNIGIGFDFLKQTAGFSISQTLIAYDESDIFARTYLVGLLNTLLASFLAIVLATVLGFVVGLMRLSKNKLLNKIAIIWVELLRNIPPLLHVLIWYRVFFLKILPSYKDSINISNAIYINIRGITVPELIRQDGATAFLMMIFVSIIGLIALSSAKKRMIIRGIHKKVWPWQLALTALPFLLIPILKPYSILLPELTRFNFSSGHTIRPELFSIVFALGTYTSTYISEIVRSSILSVDKGQIEAAKSLGFPPWKRLRLIVIPQALRTMIPPGTNQYLNIIKNTSLGVAVAYPDLSAVFAGTTLNQTGRAMEVMLIVMFTYLAISLSASFGMNQYNKKIIDKKGEILSQKELENIV